jgi:YVTN family beta-propeller protein
MRSIDRPFVLAGAVASAAWLAVSSPAAAETGPALYQLKATISLGAPDRWDYVVFNTDLDRVFVAHGDRVEVIDPRSDKVVGAVRGIPGGTHGVAIATGAGRGYSDDGHAGMAVAFDLKTLAVENTLPADQDADAIAYDAASGHVFVVNGDPGTLTVIDPKTNTVAATVKVGEKLEYLAPDGHGKLYVNGNGKGDLVRIDTASDTVDAHWPMEGCDRPKGLAVDAASRRLFASCVNDVLVVMNADTGAQVARLPIGHGSDAVAYDARRKRVLSSNRDGTLTVIQQNGADDYAVVGSVHTMVSGRTMGLDPSTGRLYIAAGDAPKDNAAIAAGSLKLLVFEPVR